MRNRYSRRAEEVLTAEDLIAEAEDYELRDVFLQYYRALKQKYISVKTELGYTIHKQGRLIAELKAKQQPPIPSGYVAQIKYQTLEDKFMSLQDEYTTLSQQYHEERRKNSPDKEMITALQMDNANLQSQLRKYRDYYNQHIAKYNIKNDPNTLVYDDAAVTIGEPVRFNSSKPKKAATTKKKMTYGNRSYNNKSKKKSRVKKRR